MGVVVVSAGYDTEVGKVKGSVNNPGAGGSDIVLLTAGDLGFAYATADERAAGMWGIRIKSVIGNRSEEHTSELQSLMRISYAVFCLKKKKKNENVHEIDITTNK